jgi:Xaa-Pro aminopeptidase
VAMPHTLPEVTSALERRRSAVGALWPADTVVLIGAGTPIPVPGRGDRTYPFRAHSEYFYLTDRERPGGVLAFDPDDGWFDFVTPVARDEALWEGADPASADGIDIAKLESWLAPRKTKNIVWLGSAAGAATSDPVLEADLRYALNSVRRPKDQIELGRMSIAEAATRAGFQEIAHRIESGRTERQLQAILESAFFLNGADNLAFDTIIAAGPNSAVLHHRPTTRAIREGDLVLIDAGAEFRGYACDVTRTYPATGRFNAEQALLFDIVREAHSAALQRCTPGTEWREVHQAAGMVIAQGLVDFGLLRGTVESLVEQSAQSLFFPHGVGHLVGLGIRDAGEVLKGRQTDPDLFPKLRVDLPLEPGYVVTVEPGVYIVPALLREPPLKAFNRDSVNWSLVERMVDFGGIRIEDDVLITDSAPRVLTAQVPLEV